MKISINPDILDELLTLNEESQWADDFLNAHYFALSDEELSLIKEKGLRKVILARLDEDEKHAYAAVQVGYGLEDIAALDPKVYQENPYYVRVMKTFDQDERIGKWVLEKKEYRAYEPFVYDEVRPSPDCPYIRYSPVGYFEKPFPYPALSQKQRTYMSLIPHEIETMKEAIEKAKGNVLTMGLGMGYFAFMASQKEEVTSVTILERDEAVLSLFKKHFLPLFDFPKKIRLLQVKDALEYKAPKPFDYLFADLHHDAEDGLPMYLKLLKRKDLAKEMDVWIEKALLHYLRRHLIVLLEEESQGYTDEDYKQEESFSDKLVNALHFHLKNYVLAKEEDLEKLLKDETLKEIASTLKI